MKTFKSILAFQAQFNTDEKCRKYLELQRWGNTPACPHCGSVNVCRFATGKLFKCRECRKKFSVTVGTVFESSKIPLTKFFLAMYILTNHSKGISSLQLAKWLDCTQRTAWFINHRIRLSLAETEPQILTGMVEADETYIGGKFKNKPLRVRTAMKATSNSHEHKTPVMGLLQRKGKLITKVVSNTRQETVLPILIDKIKLGSELHTDSSHIYKPLAKVYIHQTVNHENNEYVRGNVHVNSIEGYWNLLKKQIIGIHHSVSPKHLQRYCDESAYRYNNRTLTQDVKFADALARCDGKRLKYEDLILNIAEQ